MMLKQQATTSCFVWNIPSVMDKLLVNIGEQKQYSSNKITIVGIGAVGMATAFSILNQNISTDIALIDVDTNKLKGEMMDLNHGSCFLNSAKVAASTDYKVTENSRICIVTAGVRQKEGESRLDLVQRNTDIFKSIIPKLVKFSPQTIFLVISNPVDILTYITWKLSGLPKSRVIGSGTNLDSARFRYLLSEKLKISAESCHGWIIGEHGDSSVAVWSQVNVAGVRLQEIDPFVGTNKDTDIFKNLHRKVIDSAYDIIKLKGYTSWAIGVSAADICKAILHNTNTVHAVSIPIKGLHGINFDVFLSLPCVLGENGVTSVIKQVLSQEETKQLYDSAATINTVLQSIKY